MHEGYRIEYEASLVEEAVLRAATRLDPAISASFRAERDRIYEMESSEEREARFEELHGRFFIRLGLDGPLHRGLAEQPTLQRHTHACRVLRSCSRELADLALEIGNRAPSLVIRLRPESLLDAPALLRLLRRELAHVSDMLDPAFGYARELPTAEADPALMNLLRDRYRVVWDTTIDGRLCRSGALSEEARAYRLAEFARAFPMLGDATAAAFGRWFDDPAPKHAAILQFIQEPRGPGSLRDTRCPLCRLPALALVRVDAELARAIGRDHPGFDGEQGCCARCREVYAALSSEPAASA